MSDAFPSPYLSCMQMGGPEGVRRREATMLTLQTRGTQGIRMFLRPREEEGAGGRM